MVTVSVTLRAAAGEPESRSQQGSLNVLLSLVVGEKTLWKLVSQSETICKTHGKSNMLEVENSDESFCLDNEAL